MLPQCFHIEEKNMVKRFFCFSKGLWLIGKVKIKKRMYYERMFGKTKARVLRILNNKVKNSQVTARRLFRLFQKKIKTLIYKICF